MQTARTARALTTTIKFSFTRSFSNVNTDNYWVPFTNNRDFKKNIKLIDRTKGVTLYSDGREILDGSAGLWCCPLGYDHPKMTEALQKQAKNLCYAPGFNVSHAEAFEFAEAITKLLPADSNLNKVFFVDNGSGAVETAMKTALAYHHSQGNGQKVRFIGREKGYHGVGFGGISVGGMVNNRKAFSASTLPFVDHLPMPYVHEHMAFTKGLPEWGAHMADELENLVAFHDASTIAAVIIEPIAGSAGVLIPPQGYLQRIRDICTKHDILLIFDEVITGFGRVGAPFASVRFDIYPDMIVTAKGLTAGMIPCGAVVSNGKLYDSILAHADRIGNPGPEFFHGNTYSGHPMAMAAGLAMVNICKEEQLFERALDMSAHIEECLHGLKDLPNVRDIRNFGFLGAMEFESYTKPVASAHTVSGEMNNPGLRAADIHNRCWEKGAFFRQAGNVMATSPAFTIEKHELDRLFNIMHDAIVESNRELK